MHDIKLIDAALSDRALTAFDDFSRPAVRRSSFSMRLCRGGQGWPPHQHLELREPVEISWGGTRRLGDIYFPLGPNAPLVIVSERFRRTIEDARLKGITFLPVATVSHRPRAFEAYSREEATTMVWQLALASRAKLCSQSGIQAVACPRCGEFRFTKVSDSDIACEANAFIDSDLLLLDESSRICASPRFVKTATEATLALLGFEPLSAISVALAQTPMSEGQLLDKLQLGIRELDRLRIRNEEWAAAADNWNATYVSPASGTETAGEACVSDSDRDRNLNDLIAEFENRNAYVKETRKGRKILRVLEINASSATGICDDHVIGVAEYPQVASHLQKMNLSGQMITDAAMPAITVMAQLRSLRLHGTDVSDLGVSHIDKLRRLRELYISNTVIGDLGLQTIAKLPQLQMLVLANTRVTNVGLRCLRHSKHIAHLYLQGTGVTQSGIEELRCLPIQYLNVCNIPNVDRDVVQRNFPKAHIDW